MKIIIAGSRTITDFAILERAVAKCSLEITEVVSGGAMGVDKMGEVWARQNNIPIRVFPANWDKFGKSAGFKRNLEMAHYADGLLALWDGKSSGTKHMIETMKGLNKHGFIFKVKSNQ